MTPFVGLTDFGTYFLFLKILPVGAAKGFAFVCAGVVGYLLNKHWTFAKHEKSASEMTRYFAIQVFLLGFNIGVNHLILMPWPSALFAAAAVASVLTAVASFILKKWWVFRTAEPRPV